MNIDICHLPAAYAGHGQDTGDTVMRGTPSERSPGVRLIDAAEPSLAAGVPASPAGTLYLRSSRGGVIVPPGAPLSVLLGRDEPNVHVAIGVGDRYISREHARVHREHDHWTLTNHGKLPLQLPGSVQLLTGGTATLATGYTPIIVKHRHGPTHVVEAVVVPVSDRRPGEAAHADTTSAARLWELTSEERLAVIVLAQRYLRHEAHAQPLAWSQAAEDLAAATGDPRWNSRRVERLVEGIRKRLTLAGVAGLTRDEVGEPVGNSLNHNLITELLLTTTLVPPDLAVIDNLEW
jgi:hypothetical protein